MERLVLVDGNALVFRAYYATAYKKTTLMQNEQGENINALIVFINMFKKILTVYTKDYICVVFDSPQKTKKHQIYEQYKQKRSSTPFSLIQQICLIKRYLELSGICHFAQAGYEADDIIGTIAKQASKQKIPVLVFSIDKDFLQLIDDKIQICLIKEGMKKVIHYNAHVLWEEYSLKANQITHFKSLIGDPSDNIQGVPSIGPKTAIKLLNQFQNLDNLFKNLTQINDKIKTKLINYKRQIFFNLILVTIDTSIPSCLNYTQTKIKKIDPNLLRDFLQQNKLKYQKI